MLLSTTLRLSSHYSIYTVIHIVNLIHSKTTLTVETCAKIATATATKLCRCITLVKLLYDLSYTYHSATLICSSGLSLVVRFWWSSNETSPMHRFADEVLYVAKHCVIYHAAQTHKKTIYVERCDEQLFRVIYEALRCAVASREAPGAPDKLGIELLHGIFHGSTNQDVAVVHQHDVYEFFNVPHKFIF